MFSRTKSHKPKAGRTKDKSTKQTRKDTSSKSGKHHSNKDKRSKDETTQHIELFCAVYVPHFGNYYHWAFAMNKPTTTKQSTTKQWRLFEVLQDVEDGPFTAVQRSVNPLASARCRQPLTSLGQMHQGWWETLIQEIGGIQVPGEGSFWNCQDYVMDIWDLMLNRGMINADTWNDGKDVMMPYFGQDFGQDDSGADEMEGEDEFERDDEEGEDVGQQARVVSEEFVYDSSSE